MKLRFYEINNAFIQYLLSEKTIFTQNILSKFDNRNSFKIEYGQLVLAFTDAYIQNIPMSFEGRNPVKYIL